ncbi:hypothetical protein QYM36_003926 [Artemia franciscana]|uniref:methionyl-tRNA formyltransferase n=1 Tax=Artemia franciscana TaxID=6661 RepID=A0AA88I2P6_ARTSF|nr:hypothetical protein QYM36_003926 [Artemia franciscana]
MKPKRRRRFISRLDVVTSAKYTLSNPVAKIVNKEELQSREWPVKDLKANEYDVGVVVSFGHLIPSRIISMFPFGMINIHASLLPRWRGAAPIMHALMAGDEEVGVTLMKIHPHRFDVGEIVSQKKISVPLHLTRKELTPQLAVLGAELIEDALPGLAQKLAAAVPQPENGVTLAPKIDSSYGKFDWNNITAIELYNRWRGLHGAIPLFTKWGSKTIKLEKLEPPVSDSVATPLTKDLNVRPGILLYHKKRRTILCRCVDSWIQISELCLVGRPVQKALDFRNGFLLKEHRDNWYFGP